MSGDVRAYDPKQQAVSDLESALAEVAEPIADAAVNPPPSSPPPATLITTNVKRTAARILVCTQDALLLDSQSRSHEDFLRIARIFAEVHIVLLRTGQRAEEEKIRLTDSVWVYPVYSRRVHALADTALDRVARELVYGNSFRPDIVIAHDVREAGEAARRIAFEYNRPLQLHISELVFSGEYQSKYDLSRRQIERCDQILSDATSIRVATDKVYAHFIEHAPALADQIEVLPQYINFGAYAKTDGGTALQARFPQFAFISVFIGPLTEAGGAYKALVAAQDTMRYPSVGMLMVGEGAREPIVERARALGIDERVVVAPPGVSEVEVLSAAKLCICPAGSDADPYAALKAVSAGVPVVAEATQLILDLFTDGETAMVCGQGDLSCLRIACNSLLSNNALRRKLSRRARETVLSRIEQDEDVYTTAYKESIERAIVEYVSRTSRTAAA